MRRARGTLFLLSSLFWFGSAVAATAPQDITFVSVKVVRGKNTPAYIKIDGQYYPGFDEWPFLEVRFSTNTNLFEVRDDFGHSPASFCKDWTEFRAASAKLIKPPPMVPPEMEAVPVIDADVDTASFLTMAEYKAAIAEWAKRKKPLVYKIYLIAKAEERWSSYEIDRAYDLMTQPADVCVGVMGWNSDDPTQRGNVMTIPKASIAAAVATERRDPSPALWKGTAGSQK
jgi:hypothetical protein